MKAYLFDTMILKSIVIKNKLPAEWSYKWEEIKAGISQLVLFESLIAELFYQLIRRKKEEIVREEILKIKGLPSSVIISIDDEISFKAGKFYHQFGEFHISLVDAFSLAVAELTKGMIFTTDFGLRNAAREIKIG